MSVAIEIGIHWIMKVWSKWMVLVFIGSIRYWHVSWRTNTKQHILLSVTCWNKCKKYPTLGQKIFLMCIIICMCAVLQKALRSKMCLICCCWDFSLILYKATQLIPITVKSVGHVRDCWWNLLTLYWHYWHFAIMSLTFPAMVFVYHFGYVLIISVFCRFDLDLHKFGSEIKVLKTPKSPKN